MNDHRKKRQPRTQRRAIGLGAVAALLLAIGTPQFVATTALAGELTANQCVSVGVDGMACPFCAYGLKKYLAEIAGVESVDVDLAGSVATLTVSQGTSVTETQINHAVSEAGLGAGAITRKSAGADGSC